MYTALREQGLDRFYALRQAAGVQPEPARPSGRFFAEFDEASFHDLYVSPAADGAAAVDLYLENVHCAACVWLIEKLPRVAPGVIEARLDFGRSRARVTWDPRRLRLSAVARALDGLGYPPHPFRGRKEHEATRRQDREMLVRLGISGAAAMNVMGIAFALYGGLLHGMEAEFFSLFRWASLLITLPAMFWGGGVFFRGAWAAWRTRTMHMDLPISLGLAIGFLSGAVNTLRGAGDVYFDSVTALIVLLLAGRFIMNRQQRTAAEAGELLFSLTPRVARLLEGVEVREIPLEALARGVRVEVRAGETVPADGKIAAGHSTLDASILTGESRPVECGPGDPVLAGTVNLSSPLEVQVERTGEQTRLGKLMRLVEETSRRKAPVVLLADRISGWFVGGVLALAAATAAVWWFRDPSRVVDHVVALLIVSCPCALGLATPLAVAAAVGRAARAGFLLRGPDVIERLIRPGRLWLDKTGTLTEGKLAVESWWGPAEVQPWLAALESGSAHPVARALAAAFGPGPLLEEAAQETLGGGMAGVVAGKRIEAGSPAFLASRGIRFSEAARGESERLAASGRTPVLVAIDGEVAAAAGLADPLRADVPAAVEELRRRGWRVGILSGDHPAVVAATARRLGIPPAMALGGTSPEKKVELVRQGLAEGPVAMAGDGVNDAAALALATIGIGVHGGAEAALAAADVYSFQPGLAPVLRLMDGAQRTMTVIRRSLVFSLVYNVLAIGMAMAGLINPIAAAVLMPLSSLTVIVNSYRSPTFRKESRP